jgi:ribose/xylose/arabinose/galactoside ABC-type transport system permease subunit
MGVVVVVVAVVVVVGWWWTHRATVGIKVNATGSTPCHGRDTSVCVCVCVCVCAR